MIRTPSRESGTEVGSKPLPSSSTSRRMRVEVGSSRTVTAAACACRCTFASASCRTRIRRAATASGTWSASPVHSSVTGMPNCRSKLSRWQRTCATKVPLTISASVRRPSIWCRRLRLAVETSLLEVVHVRDQPVHVPCGGVQPASRRRADRAPPPAGTGPRAASSLSRRRSSSAPTSRSRPATCHRYTALPRIRPAAARNSLRVVVSAHGPSKHSSTAPRWRPSAWIETTTPDSPNHALKSSGSSAHAGSARWSAADTGHSCGLIHGGWTCSCAGIVAKCGPSASRVWSSVTSTSRLPASSCRYVGARRAPMMSRMISTAATKESVRSCDQISVSLIRTSLGQVRAPVTHEVRVGAGIGARMGP